MILKEEVGMRSVDGAFTKPRNQMGVEIEEPVCENDRA